LANLIFPTSIYRELLFLVCSLHGPAHIRQSSVMNRYLRRDASKREASLSWLRTLQQDEMNTWMGPLHRRIVNERLRGMKYEHQMETDPFGLIDSHINSRVVDKLRESAPEEFRGAMENIPCGTLFTMDPNAMAIITCDRQNGPVVIVDWTLWAMTYQFTLFTMEYITTKPKDSIAASRFVERLFDVGKAFASRLQAGKLIMDDVGADLKSLCLTFQRSVIGFIIAHEYGHIVLGHLDKSDQQTETASYCKFRKSWDQEFEADKTGVQLSFNFLRNLNEEHYGQTDRDFVVISPLLAILMIHHLEGFAPRRADERTHPPALERFEKLHDQLAGKISDKSLKLAMGLRSLFDVGT
jgi:hypothetical protein